ncbi:hypothetical protein L596_019363 [Steinernema carpocapsae]|uniref:Transcription factor AP-2 C-terminal domain-containing protein n=1 Tax=Steinernema carpocapsae TaxID=34508 RepID=A0A4U5MQA4_STECR|nr:hypothetical protein L596_019363 [Steinernema carpocapsae]
MSAPTNLSAFLSSISTEQFAALSAALEKEAAQQASSVMPLSPLTGLAKVKKEAVPVSPEAATAEISNKVPDDSTTQDLLAAIGSHRNEDGELTGAKEIKEEAPEMTTVDSEEDVPKTPKRRAEDDSKASEAKKVRSNIEESSLQHTDTSGSGPSIANTPILNGVINNESLAKLLLQNFHNQNFSSLLEPSAESSTKFTEVPSRLSLLTSSTKHVMSVDEVRRRIDGAENFNLSLLGSLFRRAKTQT